MARRRIGILLYGSGERERDVFAEEKYRFLAERMMERGWEVATLVYHDARQAEIAARAGECDALLVWINPIEPGLDRAGLDAFLRRMAAAGVLVSAHPDTILRIGTKDILVTSQPLGWSVEARRLASLEEFAARFPSTVRREGVRVLKRSRGNGGQGVWKITARPDGSFEILSASRGSATEIMTEETLLFHFSAHVYEPGGHLIDQQWVGSIRRGMVRAYLCGSRVAGFGYQEINALCPATAGAGSTVRAPSARHYYTEDCFLFQGLRARLEQDWVPGLLRLTQLNPDELPLLWDADFFFGEPPAPEFILCEINASCVSPFPESAVGPIITELARRLDSAARLRR
jgi:hypothetical protein